MSFGVFGDDVGRVEPTMKRTLLYRPRRRSFGDMALAGYGRNGQ